MDEKKRKGKGKGNENRELSECDHVVETASSVLKKKNKKKKDKDSKIKTPDIREAGMSFESKTSSFKKKKKGEDDEIPIQKIQAEKDTSSETYYENGSSMLQKEFNFRDYYISDIDEDEGYDPMADPNLPDSSSPSLIDMTIIVKGLDISLGENDLRAMLQNHFSQCGKLVCITIPPSDKRFAYISFYDFEACKKALALDQSKLGGMRLTVEMGEEIWEPETTSTPKSSGSKTVRVGNLDSKALESDLQEIFKSAGTIVKVTFEGFARVEFESAKAARKALKLNMKELQGRQPMKVDLLP